MQLQTFSIQTPETEAPESQGWIRYWHGYHQMRKVKSDDKRLLDRQEDQEAVAHGALTERDVEIQVFCNALSMIDSPVINMFELGAGRGDWCLALAGVVDHKIVPLAASGYRCLALEGEPSHFQWTREHFEKQGINGVAVHGAVSSYDGTCRFRAQKAPEESYGQGIDDAKGNIEVSCFRIDSLMEKYGFDHLHLIHMDVQGVEYEALQGAKKALEAGRIDILHIGTHGGDELDEKIIELVGPAYEVLFRVPASAGVVDTCFGRAHFPKDGILLLKKKG